MSDYITISACVLGIIILIILVYIYNKWTAGVCISKVDLTGKTVIVTGANTGIGYYTALDMAARNAHVILACRSMEKGEIAVKKIREITGNDRVTLKHLDLSQMKSVRKFAEEVIEEEKKLHILINNAAVFKKRTTGTSNWKKNGKKKSSVLQKEQGESLSLAEGSLPVKTVAASGDVSKRTVSSQATQGSGKSLRGKQSFSSKRKSEDTTVSSQMDQLNSSGRHTPQMDTRSNELLASQGYVLSGHSSGLPKQITDEGLELTYATNHLGPFLLTILLLDLLKKSAPSRIVVVSSYLALFSKVDFNNLFGEKSFSSVSVYGVTKLYNILFTRELAKQLEGSGVTANSLHPGTVHTKISRNLPSIVRLLGRLVQPFVKTGQSGAQTTIYCAVSEEVEGVNGKFFMDCEMAENKLTTIIKDEIVAKRLWHESTKMTGLRPED